MAVNAYLKIAGIMGNAPDGSIEIDSFSFGASNPTTVGGNPSGGSEGKVSFSDLNITKKLDKSSGELFLKTANQNNDLGTIYLKVISANEVFTIAFNGALISMYKLGDGFHKLAEGCADGGVASEGPVESISFNFAKISYESGGNAT